jgi:hypothetical protein
MNLTQCLIFEIGRACNLGAVHKKCPNLHPERFTRLDTSRELDDDTIVACARAAYWSHGFTGVVGWHYYCEPTLWMPRILALMDRITAAAPQARFILWTNGTRPQPPEVLRRFTLIRQTDYSRDPTGSGLDDRLLRCTMHGDAPCAVPYTEFILDCYGNHHPCCYDWRGEGSLGNVFCDGFDELMGRWKVFCAAVRGRRMTEEAPAVCRSCGFRRQWIHRLVPEVVERAEAWRRA